MKGIGQTRASQESKAAGQGMTECSDITLGLEEWGPRWVGAMSKLFQDEPLGLAVGSSQSLLHPEAQHHPSFCVCVGGGGLGQSV